MPSTFFNQGSPDQALSAAAELGIELVESTLQRNDSGSDFVVFEVDAIDGSQWIFRLPRREELLRTLDTERQLLRLVQSKLDVQVPNWRVAQGGVIAYRRLDGVPAASENPHTGAMEWVIDPLDPPSRYIDSIGRLMADIHSIDSDKAREIGVRVNSNADARAAFSERVSRGRRELEMDATWAARAQRWIDRDSWWPSDLCLIHGDLHPGHTLVGEDGHIVGVLDWSDAEIGDPCSEFIECSRKFPSRTLESIFAAYSRHGGTLTKDQRHAVREGIAFAPLTLGLLGLDTGQQRYVERGNAALRIPTTSD